MKKLIIIFCMLCVVSLEAWAQDPEGEHLSEKQQCYKDGELMAVALNNFLLAQGFQAINCARIDHDLNYEEVSKGIVEKHQSTIRSFMEPLWSYTRRNNIDPNTYMEQSAVSIAGFTDKNQQTLAECKKFYGELVLRRQDWGKIISVVMADLMTSPDTDKHICKSSLEQ